MDTLGLVRWSEALLGYLGTMDLGHTALLLVLFVTSKGLRRHRASDRHFVGLCWLVGLTLVAAWPLVLGRSALPVLPPQEAVVDLAGPVTIEGDTRSSGAETVASERVSAVLGAQGAAARRQPVPQTAPVAVEPVRLDLSARECIAIVCAGLYVLAVAALLTHLVAATLLVARVVRRGDDAAAPELAALFGRLCQTVCPRSRATLKLCDTIRLPATLGLVRHWVLLPREAAAQLSAGDLERVLTHELSHVRRNDVAVNLLQQIVKRAAFFNPLVWVFDRWLRNERERACDELVLAQAPGG